MDKHHITIQQAAIADADTLLTLSRETFFYFFAHLNDPANMEAYAAKAFTHPKIEAELNNPDSRFYFALFEGQIAGYLKLNFGPAQTELQDDQTIEVERIYVLAEHHGKRIGHQLLDFVIKTAKDKHFKFVWLGVWEHNHKAISFYEKHDFKVFGSHDFMLGSDKQTDLLMKRELV